eukprot:m.665896 g.665896  ORF g.665896 m.665896 type:complete len:390 (-) comp22748_c0_seq27:401-1570(-)
MAHSAVLSAFVRVTNPMRFSLLQGKTSLVPKNGSVARCLGTAMSPATSGQKPSRRAFALGALSVTTAGAVAFAMRRNFASTAVGHCAEGDGSRTHTKMRMALCQVDVTAEKVKNIATARDAIAAGAEGGAQVVSLPECWNSPYAVSAFPKYAEPVPSVGQSIADKKLSPSSAMLIESAKKHKVHLVGGSIPEVEVDADGKAHVYNTCICIDPSGTVVAKHRKVHLFDIDVPGKITFKESDTLTAGNNITIFDTPYCKIGVGICYDIRFPEQAMLMRMEGCDMLLYPGAFNMTTGPAHWTLLQRARAVDNQLYVACVSPARSPNKKDYQAWGHSSVVSPWGDVLVEATGETQPQQILFCDIDLSKVDDFRSSVPTSKQKRTDLYTFQRTA